MQTIEERGMDKDLFRLACSHCTKPSRDTPWEQVAGREIIKIVQELGYQSRKTSEGIYVYCSSWCKWRHGKASGIHKLLNIFFHKSSAFKS